MRASLRLQLVFLAWGVLIVVDGASVSTAAARKPNVLLITSEDNGPQLGCYGDANIETPNLDRLAAEGVRFEHAFVATASCSESRAAIFTGLYGHQSGQIGLATHRYAMHREFPNVPSLLKQQGYRTGIIGKLHVNPESAFPFDMKAHKASTFAQRDVRKIARIAGEFMAESDGPFFLMVNYADAHLPFIRQQHGLPEKPFEAGDVEVPPFVGAESPKLREAAADYYNCMSRMDTGVGLLLEELAATGRADQTVVIYLGDHGPQFQRGKVTCYEAGLHVPLIVRWPGQTNAGSARSELVATVDLLPTILEAVDADAPGGLAGRSLVPLLRGEAVKWRACVFAEYNCAFPPVYFPQRSVRDDRYHLILSLLDDRPNPVAEYYSRGLNGRDGITVPLDAVSEQVRGAYATFLNSPRVQLYDLDEDPYEFVNLAGRPEHAAVEERLLARLEAWRRETTDPLLDPEKLAKLTAENDRETAKYEQGRYRKSDAWQYHEYLGGGSE
ncbi:MAG: sulfatase [Planctomycetes bacterium]|nr:sulfatase [Planctomycetota bacterium]